MTVAERFLKFVSPEPMSGCWLWTGGANNGYGAFSIREGKTTKSFRAHRVAYELFVGKIPDGLQLDHLCRVRCCVNPKHLEPVTCRENLMRGDTLQAANALKTHCPQGHQLQPFTVGVKRVCETCATLASERHRRKQGMRPRIELRKTHCLRGHEFSPENTWFSKDGKKHCRQCWAIVKREHAAKYGWRPKK